MHVLMGLLALAGIVLLPGSWLTAWGSRDTLAGGTRFWLGAAVSPAVVVAQFYLLRLLGAPFPATCWLMLAINLPLAAVVLRRRAAAPVDRAAIIPVLAIALVLRGVPRALLSRAHLQRAHLDARRRRLHAGQRSAAPEDPNFAGARMAYPWFGHIQVVVVSYLMDIAPVSAYVWPNAVYLLITLALTALITRAAGASCGSACGR